ncbi:Cytochrome c-554 precursor [Allorhodopirellula heiligendammensis]|uniref:Cytochrome c-554 n=2 Tax=Allorhodopirellula heiligendammensis TaxID=2714739 RepID=A0A5C6C1X6_9BACT|nr:Cytochrome c-554 precursor [Allorhodopirellula heiligendammensis]
MRTPDSPRCQAPLSCRRLHRRRWLLPILLLGLTGCSPADMTTSSRSTPRSEPPLHDQPSDQATSVSTQPGDEQTGTTELAPQRPAEKQKLSGVDPARTGDAEPSHVARKPPVGDTAEKASPSSDGLSGPIDYTTWPVPDLTLFVTGQQHGYIEPCGCTGLENQKGGVARRMTFATQLRQSGWKLVPIDAGNLVRRFGRQAEIKFHRSLEALREMKYDAVGFGPDDMRIGVGDLIQEAAAETPEDALYCSANVVLLDPSLMQSHRIIDRDGFRVGVTSILDPASLTSPLSEDITLNDPIVSARTVLETLRNNHLNFKVLTFYGKEDTAKQLARQVPGFDLIVVAGGYGEPSYQPQTIEGTATKLILTGDKGMYVGLVGLYKDSQLRYARVPLDDSFGDAPEMRQLMAEYQSQLRDLGLENLGIKPIPHPTGEKFVGSEACGECHTTAYDIWKDSPHFNATESLVHPGERGDVPRHFDPECISCHVTGWNAQNYHPYVSGYLNLEVDKHLHGNGCENCHGPGASHAAVENGELDVSDARREQLRKAMRLPLAKAREKCMECHDLDNSPDFHKEDAFEDYWAEIEHYGLD